MVRETGCDSGGVLPGCEGAEVQRADLGAVGEEVQQDSRAGSYSVEFAEGRAL